MVRRERAPAAADYIGTMYADFDLFGPITLSAEPSSRRPPQVESASLPLSSILVLQPARAAAHERAALEDTSFMAGTRSAEHILESAGNSFAPGMIEIDPQPLVFSTYTPTEGSSHLSKSVDELLFDNNGCDCGAGSSMLTSTGERYSTRVHVPAFECDGGATHSRWAHVSRILLHMSNDALSILTGLVAADCRFTVVDERVVKCSSHGSDGKVHQVESVSE